MRDDHCVFISILACQNVLSQQERDGESESDSFVCLSVFVGEYPHTQWADRLPPVSPHSRQTGRCTGPAMFSSLVLSHMGRAGSHKARQTLYPILKYKELLYY